MPFEYSQKTGVMRRQSGTEFSGYSGCRDGLNNPAMQNVKNVGPIPCGKYTIGLPHADEKVGPVAMHLVPFSTNVMFGRGDFMIHGDNSKMNHTASEGCIILPLAARALIGKIVASGDFTLTVVKDFEEKSGHEETTEASV